jgi:outer membrane protein assembly factor BamD (BamD/ComL family)
MLRRFLFALPLAAMIASGAAPKPGAIPAFREGLDALSARLWEIAATRFETALATPDLAPADRSAILLRLAEARIRGGEADAALQALADPALAGNPDFPYWQAQALIVAGRFNEALALLDGPALAPGGPRYREAMLTRAALHRALGDPSAALETLAVLAKERDAATALRARLESASILLDQGKPDEALTATPPPNAKLTLPQAAQAEILRARAQLEKGEHQAAAGIFAALLQREEPAYRIHRHEAAVGLARTQLAAGNREAAIDGLLAFIEQERDSPQVGRAFPLLIDCLADPPAPDDVILTRLREWCPPPVIKSPIAIGGGDGSAAAWPAPPPVPDELATQALFHLAIGLRRVGTEESKARARQSLTRLRLDYPGHPLAERALLEGSRWDLTDGRKDQAAAALAALEGSVVEPALRAGASLSAAATAFDAGDFPLAATELDKAAALLDGDARRDASLNAAVARLAMGDLAGFESLAGKEPRLAADLALERGLHQAAARDPGAMAALDRFLLDHPRHPRVAEARLAAAHAALESSPPDTAFAKAQLDSLSEEQLATLPPAALALARIRLASREARHAEAAEFAKAFLATLPEDPRTREIRFELGQALFANGDYNEARLELERLATAAPDDPLAPPSLLLAARAAALVATAQAKAESAVLFDKLIAAKGPLSDVARLEKARVLAYPEAARELLPWFQSMKKDHPLRLIAGLHLCDALYNSAGSDQAPLAQALAIYGELLDGLPADSPRRFEIDYYRGRVLEQLPDPKSGSAKREKEALEVYFGVLQAAARQTPGDWQWVDKCGVRARSLLETAQRWDAAIAIADQHARLASPGAKEAAERAKALKLEHFIWDETE